MAINLPIGLNITIDEAVDSRILLTKEQMKNMADAKMPDKYFCICLDDGNLYIYNKDATPNDETGRFTSLSTGLYALIDEVKVLAEGKVSSVGAADQSVTIGGTATSPTIGIKLDNTAGNAATLSSKGLMVTPGVVISTTQPTSDSHPVWINPQGNTEQYLELRGIFTPVVKTTMDEVAQAGVMYCLGEQTAVTIPLPDNADVGQMISVVWYNGSAAATLSITGTMLPCDYVPSANSRSEVNALWDGRYWSIICNEAEVPS